MIAALLQFPRFYGRMVATGAGLALAGILVAVPASNDFEQAPLVPAPQVLPPEIGTSPAYKVVGNADGTDMQYSYTLWTPVGTYRPESTDMLYTRVLEARAIDRLRSCENDPAFFEGMKQSAAGTVNTVG